MVLNNKVNVLIFFGSPHKKGHTSTILNKYLNCLTDYFDFNVYTVNAYEENILPCIDCGFCKINHKCKYNDFTQINDFIKLADFIIVASPIYNGGFPSPLKAIWDRMQQYFYLRYKKKPFKKKLAMLILTCGCKNIEQGNIIKNQLSETFTLINTKIIDYILWSNTDENKNMPNLKDKIKVLNTQIKKEL